MSHTLATIGELHQRRMLSDLDRHLAEALSRIGGDGDPLVALAVAVASRALSVGCVCVDLHQPEPALGLQGEAMGLTWPQAGPWIAHLRQSALVGPPGAFTPLILDPRGNLYLQRYHRDEQRLLEALTARLGQRTPIDQAVLRDSLDRLFGAPQGGRVDRQKIAAMMAATRALCVITGGPGTGKTTTVVRLLAALQEQARQQGTFPLRIALLAPTGKAADRLAESIRTLRDRLDVAADIRDRGIPDQASTIHRALGFKPGPGGRFLHDAGNPLPHDVVIVDESSMVSLPLMTRLFEAIPATARIVLLGDRDQLSSVEAGAILGDLCNDGRGIPGYSPRTRAEITRLTGEPLPHYAQPPAIEGVWDHIVELTDSHRFDAASGIHAVALAINQGDAPAALSVLRGGQYADVRWHAADKASDPIDAILDAIDAPLGEYLAADDPGAALAALQRFRTLCAHRGGPLGVERINRLMEERLRRRGRLHHDGEWYAHRPVMVLKNDYQLGLYNGDIGVALPDADGRTRVWFAAGRPGDPPRSFLPARLPEHETVFAMTVHKSQGSEFDDVVLVLAEDDSPLLTRELLYTAATRARRRLLVIGAPQPFAAAVARRIRRASGLRHALWHALDAEPASAPPGERRQRQLFGDG